MYNRFVFKRPMTGCLTAKCEIDRLLMVLLYFDDRKCFLSKLSTRGLVSSGANEGNYHISRRRSIVDATALLLGGGETIRRTFPRRIRQTTIEKYRKKIEERGSLNTFEWHVVCSPNIFIDERIKKTKREKENNPRQNSSTKPTTAAAAAFIPPEFHGKTRSTQPQGSSHFY